MRWDVLIQDLSDRFEYLSRQDGADMVPELVRAERAGIDITHRLAGAVNCEITVQTHGGTSLTGHLQRVEDGWLLLESPGAASKTSIVPFARIRSVQGLGSQVDQSELSTKGKLSLLALLRQLAQSRLPVTIMAGTELTSGYVVAVGKDWLDLRHMDTPDQVTTYLLDHVDAFANHAVRAAR